MAGYYEFRSSVLTLFHALLAMHVTDSNIIITSSLHLNYHYCMIATVISFFTSQSPRTYIPITRTVSVMLLSLLLLVLLPYYYLHYHRYYRYHYHHYNHHPYPHITVTTLITPITPTPIPTPIILPLAHVPLSPPLLPLQSDRHPL